MSQNQSIQIFNLNQATLEYYQKWLDLNHADIYFNILRDQLAWKQDYITLYGKTHPVPRLQVFYSDPDLTYTYSHIRMEGLRWNETLLLIKNEIEHLTQLKFNCVLCNFYRNGRDYAAWHSDDEKELGENPQIASVSLGSERIFQARHKTRKDLATIKLPLQHGSLLVMRGEMQKYWAHQLAKTARPVGERINLTFRYIHYN